MSQTSISVQVVRIHYNSAVLLKATSFCCCLIIHALLIIDANVESSVLVIIDTINGDLFQQICG